MVQKFKCKESGCDKEVVYDRYKPIDATVKMKTPSKHKVRVYLPCEKGHWHWYEVVK